MFNNVDTFENAGVLYFLILIPLLIVWYWFRHRQQHASLQISTIQPFAALGHSVKEVALHCLFALKLIAIALLIIALARPQSTLTKRDVNIEGIDIIMSMDISGSMLAEDFKPNRLEAAKKVAQEFIKGRDEDRMGLVIFSGESFTQCPLTSDHQVLTNLFAEIKSGMIEDGTAIGDGLATAVNRLKESKAKSKVIILLTDGVSNMGSLDPISAAEIAKNFNIRIYTIGVGSMGMAPYPVQTPFGKQYQSIEVNIDEDILQQVADMTHGRYFRATDNKKLAEIYTAIDKLEKSKIDVTRYEQKHEEFHLFAILAAIVLLLEILLRNSWLRTNA